jgi:NAD(P)-dependent dehydrogenase (short-subunit alcohol dehydrogenase family)
MKARGWGRIVNFSSVEGIRSMPHAVPYTAFKGAIDSLTKSLGVEVAGAGVRVNAIAVDKTKAHQVNFYDLGEEYDRHVPVWIPAGRYAEGDDVASVVLFLSSDLCDWVVGQTIVADGGTLAAGGWYRTPTKWTNSPLLLQWFEDDPAINAARPRQVQ